MLFRHDDVTRFLREPGLSVEDRRAHDTPLTQVAIDAVGERVRQGEHAMLNRDPPDHTRLRRLVSKAFTPRMVQRFRERVQQLVDESLDRAGARGELELIGDFAFPLPFNVISEMLGLPDTGVDIEEVRSLSGLLVSSLEPVVDPEHVKRVLAAGDRMHELVGAATEAKRSAPGDDLLSALIAAQEDGDVLSVDELIDQVTLLYVAGHETTVNLIGNGVRALLADPASLVQLRADPEGLAAGAVDELLRFDSPVQMTRRITLEEVEVGGQTIEPGAFMLLVLGSANRDPAVFGPSADRLDLARADASSHLSFGGGRHYCLGASLARLEAQVAIGSLVSRFGSIEPTADPVWNGRINLRGLERLPLAVS
ncbi:MAG TPA: cytochrome P450 [Acidimicrobiales bacterium]|nr:cytochrome P450 [Acidimicrobiales bacterium]